LTSEGLNGNGFSTKTKGESVIKELVHTYADQFYQLDRDLFLRQEPAGSRVLLVTSSHLGEGVTSVVLAFAMFLARIHGPEGVIAVEANLRRPSFAGVLGCKPTGSLQQVTTGAIELAQAVQRPEGYGFAVITAGVDPDKDGPIVHESGMEKMAPVLAGLRETYRYILVDSPPVIPFLDPSILASQVDHVVVVVASNMTRSEVLNHAIDRLKSVGAPISGIVLNKREFYIPQWAYRFL
jgi:Mrp family chromosome partitioning ATPase